MTRDSSPGTALTPAPRPVMLPCQKGWFSLPPEIHYLNCAYMSPLSRSVEEAGVEGVRRKRNPAAIAQEDFFTDSDRARERFARLVHAPDPRRVAIIPSVSYGMAVVARNTPVWRGQNIVVAHEQFPSNVYGWRTLCRREGLVLRSVAPPERLDGRETEWNVRLLEAIDRETAVVALGHVHWADGTRFDLERIGQRARECGAALVVDGTQSVGALPFDVGAIQPDALVCAAYKWLTGPYSIGCAYFGARYDEGSPVEETWLGRLGSEDFRRLVQYEDQYQPGAIRYDVGQRSNFILVPMLIAALDQLLEWEVDRIQEYCRVLTAPLTTEARELGFAVADECSRGSHLFGLRAPPGVDLERLHRLLRERNVFASLRGTALRVSPNVYNDETDVATLLEVLRTALRQV